MANTYGIIKIIILDSLWKDKNMDQDSGNSILRMISIRGSISIIKNMEMDSIDGEMEISIMVSLSMIKEVAMEK